jgi:hypothetical protein
MQLIDMYHHHHLDARDELSANFDGQSYGARFEAGLPID